LLLELLEGFTFLLVLGFDIFFLLLNSGDSLLEGLLVVFLFLLEAVFVSFDGLAHLFMVLLDSLLLEGQSLVFESLFSFEIDPALSEFIHCSFVFLLQLFNFLVELYFFVLDLAFELFVGLFFAFKLGLHCLFHILKRHNGSVSLGNFH